jgi:hypothetical protein
MIRRKWRTRWWALRAPAWGEGSLRGSISGFGAAKPSGRAGSRYGRGLNTPHYLTVFNGPSSRVRIRGGQRGGFKDSRVAFKGMLT